MIRKQMLKTTLSTVLFLLLCVVFASRPCLALELEKPIQMEKFYMVTSTDSTWRTFQTVEQMREAVHLDENQLSKCSTQEVLRAILEYPLVGDLLLFNTPQQAVGNVSAHCTALRVFLRRNDAIPTLGRVLTQQNNLEKVRVYSEKPETLDRLILSILEEYCRSVRRGGMPSSGQSTSIVYTPRGSSVPVEVFPEMPQNMIDEINRVASQQYPQAQLVSSSSAKYNCHSYAWYWSSPSNSYWMNDPSAYMRDGSYSSVSTIATATHVYYPRGDHSALVYDASGSSLDYARLISKWGRGPLMIHKINYCPYTGGYSFWR